MQYSQYASDGRLVWQHDETTNQRIANAYLAGSLLAEISRPLTGNTTTIRYLHTDALGSPIAKTSATGAIIETSEYEPYGRLLNRANDNRAGYTGHVMDAASGLTYMQQRYYDPQLGVFLSVDPVTAYSNPVGAFNRYWYANGNPYRFVDPDGRVTVVVVNKNDLIGHAGWVMIRGGKTLIYDPAGDYNQRGSRGNSSMVEDGTLEGYIAHAKREGPDVEVITFLTSAEEEAAILNQTEVGSISGGFCSIATGQSLRGVGPFKDLGATVHPYQLAREAARLQQEAAKEKGVRDN
ncbi:MAG: hypothetical protein K8F33_04665 [Thermomonas sp.]|nr:hypothetical protein [Thermomonas sp.]